MCIFLPFFSLRQQWVRNMLMKNKNMALISPYSFKLRPWFQCKELKYKKHIYKCDHADWCRETQFQIRTENHNPERTLQVSMPTLEWSINESLQKHFQTLYYINLSLFFNVSCENYSDKCINPLLIKGTFVSCEKVYELYLEIMH